MKTREVVVCVLIVAAFVALDLPGFAAEAPEPRSRSEVEAVLAKAPKPVARKDLRKLNIVLVAFKKDHSVDEHDYPLWQKRWHVLLGGSKAGQGSEKQVNLYGPAPQGKQKKITAGVPKVTVTTATGWPNKQQLKKADLIAMFCYGKWDEQKLGDLEKFLSRGGGFVAVHPAVIPEKNMSLKLASLIGLAWEDGYTGWRHGPMDLKIAAPDHPICLGLPKTIHLLDEAYWPFKGDRSKVTVLATSDEKVSKESEQTRPEPMFYAYKYGKGRAFTCVLGHYTWTFDDPYVRMLLLRGMAWAAGESPYRFDPLVLRGVPLSE
ncbi:MAG: ThuA domain-containing protein [Phycisphaerales bacterium]|nr:MAG: ThuA domain-containing protein [Phycisphaerales bacterium]